MKGQIAPSWEFITEVNYLLSKVLNKSERIYFKCIVILMICLSNTNRKEFASLDV